MDNPYLPPQSDTSIQAKPQTLEYDGKALIIPKDFTFPAMCIKTGAVDDLVPQRVKKLSWYPPLTFVLLIIGGPLLFILVAVFVGKRGVIRFQLSRAVAEKRRKQVLWNWGIFALSIGLFVLAGVFDDGRFALAGGIALLASLIMGARTSQFLMATKINKTCLWLKGVPEPIARALVASEGLLPN